MPSMVGKVSRRRPDFQEVVNARFREQLRLVFSPAEVYDVTYPSGIERRAFRHDSHRRANRFSEERGAVLG